MLWAIGLETATTHRLQRGSYLRMEQGGWGIDKAADNLCPVRQAGDWSRLSAHEPCGQAPRGGWSEQVAVLWNIKKKKPAKHVLCVQGELPNSCPWNNFSGLSIRKRLNLESEEE